MTYKPVSVYTKKNRIVNSVEYFCSYYSKRGRLLKARITKTTFDNIKNKLSLAEGVFNKQKGVRNEVF